MFILLWAAAQGIIEGMTILQEEKGIFLSGIGVLADDTNSKFIIFVLLIFVLFIKNLKIFR